MKIAQETEGRRRMKWKRILTILNCLRMDEKFIKKFSFSLLDNNDTLSLMMRAPHPTNKQDLMDYCVLKIKFYDFFFPLVR